MKVRSCSVVTTGEGVRLTITASTGRRLVFDFHRTDAEAVGCALKQAWAEHKDLHRPLDTA